MALHLNRSLFIATSLLAAALLAPVTTSSQSTPEVKFPDPDVGIESLAARRKAQVDATDQFKVFFKFRFADALKDSGITFFHHMVDDAGISYTLTYLLNRQQDDQWRIAGCVVTPQGREILT